jgi:hypothetical protein
MAEGTATPSITTVQFGDIKFRAFSTDFSMFTPYGADGLQPQMGQTAFAIQVFVDMHDNSDLTFDKVKYLFENSHSLTSDKVKDCKLIFWQDDRQSNALSTFSFKGWIAHFNIMSGGGTNHLLMIRFQPRPNEKQFVDIQHGN